MKHLGTFKNSFTKVTMMVMDVNQQKCFFNRWQQRCGSDIPYDLPYRNKDGKKKKKKKETVLNPYPLN